MLSLLHKNFISSWVLHSELEQYAEGSSAQSVSIAASLALDAYVFPVQVLIQDPSGYVITSINANQILDVELNNTMILQGFYDPAEYAYYRFLEEGLKKYNYIFMD